MVRETKARKNGQARSRKTAPALARKPEVEPSAPKPAATGPSSFRRLLYMYGAVTQIELNNFLLGNSVDSEERQQEIKTQWLNAAEAFQQTVNDEAGLAESITTQPLGAELSGVVEDIRNNPAFTKTFSNYPLSFEEIEIDRIVASQRTVHLDFVEEIKAKAKFSSAKELATFSLHPGQDTTPLKFGRTAQNAFTFSSENPSLRFLDAVEHPYATDLKAGYHPGGQPIHAVTILVGYGISTINVFRVGKRIILNNGFHRLYALRSLGIASAPVVVQHITHPELELPQVIADLPRDYLISAPRPALMKDFFNPVLNCEVRQRNFIKALQVGWGIEDRRVPT
jgi:hypothetical protein